MEPEVFLEQRDVVPLTKAMIMVLMKINTASDRQSVFESAGLHPGFLGNLKLDTQPNILAQTLIAEFKRYRLDSKHLDYHPMISLLSYISNLPEIYILPDQDVILFKRLVEQGQENFQALIARSAVGRIESPSGTGIGTGVLVGKNLLLTCHHVFSKTQVQQAWVRFGYKTGSYGLEKIYPLDHVTHNHRLDYALMRMQGQPPQSIVSPNQAELNTGQEIRLIHHPLGKPVVISDVGQITQVGEDYFDHNIQAEVGSSGAPIFDREWKLIGIHRGNPGIPRVIKGTSASVPVRVFWFQIVSSLLEAESGADL